MARAEILETRDAVSEEVMLKGEVRIVFDDESEGRRNLFVNLSHDDAWPELRQQSVQDPVVIRIYVQAQNFKVGPYLVGIQQAHDILRRDLIPACEHIRVIAIGARQPIGTVCISVDRESAPSISKQRVRV